MVDVRRQAVTGVIPPQVAEARIREAWPSVARASAIASLGRLLTHTILLAPLGWLLMSALYFGKLLPFVATRYTLTNRRLMIRKGIKGKPSQEIPLSEIDDVRIVTDANSDFFRAATLELLSKGQVRMKLAGVPEADSFRLAILNARNAWVPEKSKTMPFIPASAAK
jgi:uncharacterized membrane protein YdbT with pleckstrin-like domain